MVLSIIFLIVTSNNHETIQKMFLENGLPEKSFSITGLLEKILVNSFFIIYFNSIFNPKDLISLTSTLNDSGIPD